MADQYTLDALMRRVLLNEITQTDVWVSFVHNGKAVGAMVLPAKTEILMVEISPGILSGFVNFPRMRVMTPEEAKRIDPTTATIREHMQSLDEEDETDAV